MFLPWKSHILNYLAHIIFTSNIYWCKWTNIKIYFSFWKIWQIMKLLVQIIYIIREKVSLLFWSFSHAFHFVLPDISILFNHHFHIQDKLYRAGRLASTLTLFHRNLYGVSTYTSIIGNWFHMPKHQGWRLEDKEKELSWLCECKYNSGLILINQIEIL